MILRGQPNLWFNYSSDKWSFLDFDEFPYLVATNKSLPSLFQKWIDHKQPENLKLILSGSSQTMMHSTFLDSSSPLFERANRTLNIRPMDYKSFREFLNIKSNNIESFMKYSITGGIPKYWEYINTKQKILELVDNMFFSDFSFLENEPYRILKDENVKGIQALSILEAIGRGAAKPSEIAKKLSIPQTSLSRPLQVLQDASIITRELPFGESIRSTKKILYHISDYGYAFLFDTC